MEYSKPYRPQQPEDLAEVLPMVYVKEGHVWEYKRLTCNLAKSEPPSITELNHLGKEGWELTTTLTHGDMLYCYLKRFV
jgi:hypothetical protein